MERGTPNGHAMEVSPLEARAAAQRSRAAPELGPVVNAFDPWARDRGDYYSLEWKPRPDARSDPAFAE